MSGYVPPKRIHIPSFNSPVKQSTLPDAASQPQPAAAEPQTRQEARGARLNQRLKGRRGGAGLANFQELMRASAAGGGQQQPPPPPVAGPSRTPAQRAVTPKAASVKKGATPKSAAARRKSTAASARPSSAKSRRSAVQPSPAPELPAPAVEEAEPTPGAKGKRRSSVRSVASSKGKGKGKAREESVVVVDEEDEPAVQVTTKPTPARPAKRPRASTKAASQPRPSTSAPALTPSTSAAPVPTPRSRPSTVRKSAARKSVAPPPLPTPDPTAQAQPSPATVAPRKSTVPRAAMRAAAAAAAASRASQAPEPAPRRDGKGKGRAEAAAEPDEVMAEEPEPEPEPDVAHVAIEVETEEHEAEKVTNREAEDVTAPVRAKKTKVKKATDGDVGRVAKNRGSQPDKAPAASKPAKKKRKPSPPPSPEPAPPPKRRRPSPVRRSPTPSVESADASDAEIDPPETQSNPSDVGMDSEPESDDERRAGKASVRIATERLQGNDGKLNAIDVVWERVRGVLRAASENVKGPAATALHHYADSIQLALLTRSDTTSALAHSAALATAARASAKQLRGELLGVRQARAGVGARMRAEEQGWREGRRRNEVTRKLHRFAGELEVGKQEWGGAAGDGGEADVPLRARLEAVSRALGGGAGAEGTLARRVERLNSELRSLQG